MNNSFEGYLRSQGMANSSIASADRAMEMFFQWLSGQGLGAAQAGYGDMLGFIKMLKDRGTKAKTVQGYMGFVRHYYDHLVQEGQMDRNPMESIEIKGAKRKALYKILGPEELNGLYNGLKGETARARRDRAMLGLYLYQGLKTEEMGRLGVKDIKLREGTVEVPGGKKSNGRALKLEPHQVLDLYDYILQARPALQAMPPKHRHQKPQTTDRLIISEGGCGNISNMATQLMAKLRKLNKKVVNAKHLRASVVTKWAKAHNLRKAQYMAGHRYISTTESYLQNDMEGLREEINMYHPLG